MTPPETRPCRGAGCGNPTLGFTAECPDGRVSDYDQRHNAEFLEDGRFWLCPDHIDELD